MIRVWGYLDEYEAEKTEVHDAIETVLSSGRLMLGPCLEAFESEFAAYCGVQHGVGVDNGTNAIILALRALGIREGDEVITVANTAVPTVSAIVSAGGQPRFVDIDANTYLMDVNELEAAVTPRTRYIVVVHLYGQCVEMDTVARVAATRDLRVVEDCAQSHGAQFRDRRAGSMSDAAAFSFYPTKILGGYGDGGMVITDHADVAERLRRLRFYGMKDQYFSVEHGYNSRLDELHAEILRRKLGHLDDYIARRLLAQRYDERLASTSLILPQEAENRLHAYYLYVVRHPQRDRIIKELATQDIMLNVSYPWPIHTMPPYQYAGCGEGDLPQTEAAAREIFSLPMYPSLGERQQDEIIAALLAALSLENA